MDKLKILLPKGRIYDNVVSLFSGSGISVSLPDRAYRPTVNQEDLEAKVMKPQNIGKLLELGAGTGFWRPAPMLWRLWIWALTGLRL